MRALVMASVMAAPVMAQSSFSGPYVGVGFKTGFLKTAGSASKTTAAGGTDPYTVGSSTAEIINQSKTAFSGDLLAGMGWDMDDFFVGAEMFGSFGNANQSQVFNTIVNNGDPTDNVEATFSVGSRFGATARVGYVFTPSILGYIGVGVQIARLKTTWSDAYVDDIKTTTGSKNKTAFMFAPTVGIEGALMQNVSARLEYTFLKYPTQTVVATVSADEYSTLTVKPKEHQVRLALIYRF